MEIPVYTIVTLSCEENNKVIGPNCYFSLKRAINAANDAAASIILMSAPRKQYYTRELDRNDPIQPYMVELLEDWESASGYAHGTSVKYLVWVYRLTAEGSPLEILAECAE